MRSIRAAMTTACAALTLMGGCVRSNAPAATGGSPRGAAGPELFEPGTISTALDELNAVFSPDGSELYYSINSPNDGRGAIVVSRRSGTRWSAPEVVSLSGRYSDYDPFLSTDGRQLFFISNRPKDAPKWEQGDYDIYVADRTAAGWSEPRNLGAPINTDRPEWFPSVASDGTLYFSAARADSRGGFDLYRSPRTGETYGPPENLGDSINGRGWEIDNYIAPDQSYLIFAARGRPDDLGGGDLYISRRRNGAWTAAVNLGPEVNSPAREYTPAVSPDGKYLYWTSKRGFVDHPLARALTFRELQDSLASVRNGNGNIYRLPTAVLRERPPAR